MWVYQETPEAAAGKALPEAIMPTAQEEPLKQKNRGVLPETAQEERRSIRRRSLRVAEIHRREPLHAAASRVRGLPFWRRRTFWGPFWRVWRQRVAWQAMPKRFPIT